MADPLTVDWNDPCAAAETLRTAYMELLQGGGGQITKIRFGDREVNYSATGGNLNGLRDEMLRQEALCAIKTGSAPRHAIKFGFVRRCF